MNRLFRVWCKNNHEWEKDKCFLDSYGDLWSFNSYNPIRLKQENHIVEINTGLLDTNNQPIFVGDIVRHEDGNSGYGRLRDYYFDGYVYIIVDNENYYEFSGEYSVNYDKHLWLEKVGNIHETELTDSMKFWTDPEWFEEFKKKHKEQNLVGGGQIW